MGFSQASALSIPKDTSVTVFCISYAVKIQVKITLSYDTYESDLQKQLEQIFLGKLSYSAALTTAPDPDP